MHTLSIMAKLKLWAVDSIQLMCTKPEGTKHHHACNMFQLKKVRW